MTSPNPTLEWPDPLAKLSNKSSYMETELSTENCFARSRPFFPIWLRLCGLSSKYFRASAMDSRSPTGTSRPSSPFEMISLGPDGQSVDTTAAPQAIASISASGIPSCLDDRANIVQCFIYEGTLSTKPG